MRKCLLFKLNKGATDENGYSGRNELVQKRGSCWKLADQPQMVRETRNHRFQLDRFGEIVSCETESDQTGWVIVKPRGNVSVGDTIPLL